MAQGSPTTTAPVTGPPVGGDAYQNAQGASGTDTTKWDWNCYGNCGSGYWNDAQNGYWVSVSVPDAIGNSPENCCTVFGNMRWVSYSFNSLDKYSWFSTIHLADLNSNSGETPPEETECDKVSNQPGPVCDRSIWSICLRRIWRKRGGRCFQELGHWKRRIFLYACAGIGYEAGAGPQVGIYSSARALRGVNANINGTFGLSGTAAFSPDGKLVGGPVGPWYQNRRIYKCYQHDVYRLRLLW